MHDSTDAEASLSLGTWIGREQAFNAVAHHCSAARVACLKQVRDTEAYKRLNLTWEQFCSEKAGLSRAQADRLIHQLAEFGAPYFQLTDIVPVSPASYREIAPAIADGTIEFRGEQIPITPENAAKVKAAVTALRKEIERVESDARVRTPPTITTLMIQIDSYCEDIERLQHRASLANKDEPALRSLITYSINKLNKLKPAGTEPRP